MMTFGVRLMGALSGVLLLGLANACPCCVPAQPGRVVFVPSGAPACCAMPAAAAPGAPAMGKMAGMTDAPAPAADVEAKIKANLAKLSDDDRKLAEAQKFCAVETDHRLGAMGVPIKVMVKDQPVFVCCKGCVQEAQADPDKTLATVKELKAKSAQPAK